MKAFITNSTLFGLLATMLSVCFSCSDANINPTDTWLDVYLEDSPADYKSVEVRFSTAAIYNGTAWITLPVYRKGVKLLELTGGASLKLISTPLEPGHYSRLKLTFEPMGNLLECADSTFALPLADEYANVELDINLDVKKDDFNYIYCDMDAAKSVYVVNDTTFQLRPSIRAIDLNTYGAVTGFVANSEGVAMDKRMYAQIFQGQTEVVTSYTNGKTGLLFVRLPKGEYSLKITPDTLTHVKDTLINNIIIKSGQPTDLGAMKLSEIKPLLGI